MWPRLLYCMRNKIHVDVEDSKEIHTPAVAEPAYLYAVPGLCSPKTPWRQHNKYFLELLFTFPNLVVFLTCAIMWWTGSSLLASLVHSSPPVPTHWQALDLESTVLIVIYASLDDRCAHIVLSIRLRQLKVIARLVFNRRISPRMWDCHHISQLIRSDHKRLLLHAATDKIQSLHSSEALKGDAVPGKYQAGTQSFTRGHFWVRAQCTTLH